MFGICTTYGISDQDPLQKPRRAAGSLRRIKIGSSSFSLANKDEFLSGLPE